MPRVQSRRHIKKSPRHRAMPTANTRRHPSPRQSPHGRRHRCFCQRFRDGCRQKKKTSVTVRLQSWRRCQQQNRWHILTRGSPWCTRLGCFAVDITGRLAAPGAPRWASLPGCPDKKLSAYLMPSATKLIPVVNVIYWKLMFHVWTPFSLLFVAVVSYVVGLPFSRCSCRG